MSTEALAEWQRKLEAGEVEKTEQQNPIERLRSAPESTRKLAIDAFCCECMGAVRNGEISMEGVMGSIRTCPAKDCPLYPWRPYK